MTEEMSFEQELKALNTLAKRAGKQLIAQGQQVADKMNKWSDETEKPLSDKEWAGFKSIKEVVGEVSYLLDIQAPENEDRATLRVSGIIEGKDGKGRVAFNRIDLIFDIGYESASTALQQVSELSRADIQAVMQNPRTSLRRTILSNQSGMDQKTEEVYGERFDLEIAPSEVSYNRNGLLTDNGQDSAPNMKKVAQTIDVIVERLGGITARREYSQL